MVTQVKLPVLSDQLQQFWQEIGLHDIEENGGVR